MEVTLYQRWILLLTLLSLKVTFVVNHGKDKDNGVTTGREMTFKETTQTAAPQASPPLNQERGVRSDIECAVWCAENPPCKSFAAETRASNGDTNGETKACTLYPSRNVVVENGIPFERTSTTEEIECQTWNDKRVGCRASGPIESIEIKRIPDLDSPCDLGYSFGVDAKKVNELWVKYECRAVFVVQLRMFPPEDGAGGKSGKG